MKMNSNQLLITTLFLSLFLFIFAKPAQAAYSCNVSATSVGALYSLFGSQDVNGTVTFNCTRSSGDANTLTYRIKADTGLYASGNQRNVAMGGNQIPYYLTHGSSVGGAATCANSTNWLAPTSGTANVITGTLNFGASLSASALWGFCVRVRGIFPFPTNGVYTDTVQVFGQYPNSNSGTLTASSSLNYSVGVGSQCVFNTFPGPLNFNYTSFSSSAQTSSQTFNIACSNNLPWTVSVAPASNTLLGLTYNLNLSPPSGTGTGLNQLITITGTIPANQAGSCGTAVCSASFVHTVTISY